MTNTFEQFLDLLEKRALSVIKSETGKDALALGELDASLLAIDVQVFVKMARNLELELDPDKFDVVRKRTIREVLDYNAKITGWEDPYDDKD